MAREFDPDDSSQGFEPVEPDTSAEEAEQAREVAARRTRARFPTERPGFPEQPQLSLPHPDIPSESIDPLSGATLAKPNTAISVATDAQATRAKRMMTPELYNRLTSPIAVPKDYEEYLLVPEGKKWRDPKGNVKIKPYEIEDPDRYWSLPEGAHWKPTDADQIFVKPHYEGIGLTAQYLYSAALTDEGRQQALEKVYDKDKIKRGPGGRFYVDDDGVLRAPGEGASRLGAAIAETPPAVGMTGGALAGGIAGGGVGTPVTATGGAILGAMLGRAFNSGVLALAGIHEPLGAQIGALGFEGAAVAGGEVAGKAISKVPQAVQFAKRYGGKAVEAAGKPLGTFDRFLKSVSTGLGEMLEDVGVTPARARYFLGTTGERGAMATQIAEKGGKVPISVLGPEAPFLKKVQEFNDIFQGRSVFGEAAEELYNREAQKIVTAPEVGATREESFTRATKAVSSEQAGELAISAAQRDAAIADGEMENARRDVLATTRQTGMETARRGVEEAIGEPVPKFRSEQEAIQVRQAAVDRLEQTMQASRMHAEHVFQEEITALRRDVQTMLDNIREGEDPSIVAKMVEERFRAYNAALRVRANGYYDAAKAAGRGVTVDTEPLLNDAVDFLASMPEMVRSKYPSEISKLARLAQQGQEAQAGAVTIEEAGKPPRQAFTGAQPPEPLDAADLHALRSWFRHGLDYNDLTPDMRAGATKLFADKIDKVLNNVEASPQMREFSRLLKIADDFYKKNIPFLDDEMVTQSLKAFKSGAGVDAEKVADIFFKPGRTAALQQARSILGENAWNAVESARVRSIINDARIPGSQDVDGRKIATAIWNDDQNGLLRTGYTVPRASNMSRLADDARRLEGTLPIRAEDTDTISTLMRKIERAKAAVEKLAETDPIAALRSEVKRIDTEFNRAATAQQKARQGSPLGFLAQPSALAVRSADKILGSPDLIRVAADQFGRESPEFKALQQTFVLRFFQRSLDRLGLMRAELAGDVSGMFGRKGISEETQALLFPGVTREQMNTLAKEMEFLFSGIGVESFGGGMAGAARVLNPLQHVPVPRPSGAIGRFIMNTPIASFLARFALGKVYAAVIDGLSHPNFIYWLTENLKGSLEQRMVAKMVLNERLRLGGWFGAAAAQQLTTPNPQPAEVE